MKEVSRSLVILFDDAANSEIDDVDSADGQKIFNEEFAQNWRDKKKTDADKEDAFGYTIDSVHVHDLSPAMRLKSKLL